MNIFLGYGSWSLNIIFSLFGPLHEIKFCNFYCHSSYLYHTLSQSKWIQNQLNKLWINVSNIDTSNIDTFMSNRTPSPEENEEGATECEYFCEIFPVLFPTRNLTKKISLVLPTFIRNEPGMLNKILRLEQEGEHLHSLMNRAETKYKSTKNKSERY